MDYTRKIIRLKKKATRYFALGSGCIAEMRMLEQKDKIRADIFGKVSKFASDWTDDAMPAPVEPEEDENPKFEKHFGVLGKKWGDKRYPKYDKVTYMDFRYNPPKEMKMSNKEALNNIGEALNQYAEEHGGALTHEQLIDFARGFVKGE